MVKKKRLSLPRVTVLALSRKELAAFASAVETLGHLVEDLRLMLVRRKAVRSPARASESQDSLVPIGVLKILEEPQ